MAHIVGEKTRQALSCSTLTGDPVVNMQEEDLGKIEEFMLDMEKG